MSIQIQATPSDQFELTVDGKSLGIFKKVSEWEGFVKFNGKDGTIIATGGDESFISALFDNVFGGPPEPKTLSVVKATPGLLPRVSPVSSSDVVLEQRNELTKVLYDIASTKATTSEGHSLAVKAHAALNTRGFAAPPAPCPPVQPVSNGEYRKAFKERDGMLMVLKQIAVAAPSTDEGAHFYQLARMWLRENGYEV